MTVSPFRPSFPPQSDVYPKGPRCLPSLPTTHYPPTTFLRPLFSYRYKSLFPQPFSFHIHTKPRGGGISLRSISPLASSPLFSSACRLFGIPKKVNSFAIKQIRTPFRKHLG